MPSTMTSNDETPAMRRERRKRGSFQAPVYLSAHSNTNRAIKVRKRQPTIRAFLRRNNWRSVGWRHLCLAMLASLEWL